MQSTILLISPEAGGQAIADALRQELNAVVTRLSSRRAGLATLRRSQFSLILLDEALAEADPRVTDLLFQNAGAAPVLEIGMARVPAVRVVRQARTALQRRAADERRAREMAAASLEAELRASLSGLLLESQLALREALPEQAPKLRHLVQLAGNLRERLRV